MDNFMIDDIMLGFDWSVTPVPESGLVEHLLVTVSNMANSLAGDFCSVEVDGWRAEGHYSTEEDSLVLTLRYSLESYSSEMVFGNDDEG